MVGRLLITLAALSALTGCVAVWGQSYNVAMTNSRSVVVEYDPAVVNMPAMLKEAQDHCDRFGKDAVLHDESTGNLGIRVNTYRCESRNSDQTIDVQS